jgi:hypothetical protein
MTEVNYFRMNIHNSTQLRKSACKASGSDSDNIVHKEPAIFRGKALQVFCLEEHTSECLGRDAGDSVK